MPLDFVEQHRKIFPLADVKENPASKRYNEMFDEESMYYSNGLRLMDNIERMVNRDIIVSIDVVALTLAYLFYDRKDDAMELTKIFDSRLKDEYLDSQSIDMLSFSAATYLFLDRKKHANVLMDIIKDNIRFRDGLVDNEATGNLKFMFLQILNDKRKEAVELLGNLKATMGFYNGLIRHYLTSDTIVRTEDNALLALIYILLNRKNKASYLVKNIEICIGFDDNTGLAYNHNISEYRDFCIEPNALLAMVYLGLAGRLDERKEFA